MKQQTEIVNQNSRCFGDVFWSSRAVAHEFSGAKVHLRTVKDSILGDVLVMFWVCFCDDLVMFWGCFGDVKHQIFGSSISAVYPSK